MAPLIQKIEPGDVIGRCRLIRELGRGGVGTVYLATHQTLQIEVALKVLSPALSMDNPALAERFIREAQLAARIRHPNVIAVMDAAQDETTGLYFIVMEYVGGGSLSWHLRNGPLPEAKALGIVTGIAHALAIAEENRIVHRDIKPDNIMLDLRGTAKLADLGLAKHDIDSRTSLTLGGSFMGTPAYMSPQQARDAKVADTRDDIYSLGATFYECLTGKPPFEGETPYNIMSELLTKPSPRPRDVRPELSRSTDLVCRKMMAKTRDLRYADAQALLQDLQTCQTFGDAGLNRLEAASFDRDSQMARKEALTYGVETSADGVAVVPEPPEDSEVGPIRKPTPAVSLPRRSDYGVFRAAALLVALVTAATFALAWMSSHHSFSFLRDKFAVASSPAPAPAPVTKENPPQAEAPPTAVVPIPMVKVPENPPVVPPVTPVETAANQPQPVLAPIPSPIVPTPEPGQTNVAPIDPLAPVPAIAAVPDSAFAARGIAEAALPPGLINSGTGRADLVRVVGKRDNVAGVAPTVWTFYFYDKSAAGHARIVSVENGKATAPGEDLAHTVLPYKEPDILPEDKLLTDSTQALQIAEALVPGVEVSSSQLDLTQKNWVPTWKVTLWAKGHDGDEVELGNASVLAEKGYVSGNLLKPERVEK